MIKRTKYIYWHKIFEGIEAAEFNTHVNRPEKINVLGKEVCLVRTTTGFYAIDNKCPHNGAQLHRGKCTLN